MKFGVRTPSIKRSISARTTGRVKRALKSSINPTYGKKGMGIINSPKKVIYNKLYNKTTIKLFDLIDYKNSISNSSYDILSKDDKEKLSYKLNNTCNEYRKIITETTDPLTFFETYDALLEALKIMQKYENDVNWENANPSMMLGETIAIKYKCIRNLIDNIYKEQKSDGKKVFSILFDYLELIDDENIKYLNSLNN